MSAAQLTLAACLLNEATVGTFQAKDAVGTDPDNVRRQEAIERCLLIAFRSVLDLTLAVGLGTYSVGRLLKLTFDEQGLTAIDGDRYDGGPQEA